MAEPITAPRNCTDCHHVQSPLTAGIDPAAWRACCQEIALMDPGAFKALWAEIQASAAELRPLS